MKRVVEPPKRLAQSRVELGAHLGRMLDVARVIRRDDFNYPVFFRLSPVEGLPGQATGFHLTHVSFEVGHAGSRVQHSLRRGAAERNHVSVGCQHGLEVGGAAVCWMRKVLFSNPFGFCRRHACLLHLLLGRLPTATKLCLHLLPAIFRGACGHKEQVNHRSLQAVCLERLVPLSSVKTAERSTMSHVFSLRRLQHRGDGSVLMHLRWHRAPCSIRQTALWSQRTTIALRSVLSWVETTFHSHPTGCGALLAAL